MHIDWWTLALQTVNVLILVWLLARFFFRPIMAIVAKRQDEANRLLADAAQARKAAIAQCADADAASEKIAEERDGLIAAARQAAQIEKQNLLAKTAAEIAKLRGEAASALARDRAAAEQAIIDRASELSVDIAQRLLRHFPQQDILYAFVDEICCEVSAMSPEARHSLAAAATGHPIEVFTAAPLSAAQTEHVHGALKEAFGLDPPLAFRGDPAVIAGIEIKGQNAIISNSWRADLERIRQELSRDQHVRRS